jgi:hypothetical protein
MDVIWKTTIAAAVYALQLAVLAVEQDRRTYRVPVVDHTGRTVQ